MALSRFTVGTTVTLPAGTPSASEGEFGTVSYAGTGTGAEQQWAGGVAARFLAGQVIYADDDPADTPTGAQQLYTALAAAGANLRPFTDGTDAVGHYGTSN